MKWIGKSAAQHCNIDIGASALFVCFLPPREKGKERREAEKPIECGKSFHLITQRDHKLTDNRPRKRTLST